MCRIQIQSVLLTVQDDPRIVEFKQKIHEDEEDALKFLQDNLVR